MSGSLQPLWTRLLCPWDFPGKNTGVGCHFFFQGIFPSRGLNSCLLCLLHQQAGSSPLLLPGKPVPHGKPILCTSLPNSWGFLVVQTVKNPPAMQQTWVRSLGWEDPLETKMATHSSILASRIPRTREPGRLLSMGLQESDMTEQLLLSPIPLQTSPYHKKSQQHGPFFLHLQVSC